MCLRAVRTRILVFLTMPKCRRVVVVDSHLSAVVIGFLLSGACTVLIGYVNCRIGLAVGLVVLSTAFIGISSAAVLGVNQLDLSPRYAGQTTRYALLCSVVRMKLMKRWPAMSRQPIGLATSNPVFHIRADLRGLESLSPSSWM